MMPIKRMLVAGCLVLGLMPSIGSAVELSPGKAVGEIIAEMESSTKKIISAAELSGSRLLWALAQQSQAVIDSLKSAYQESMETTFDRLDKSEEAIFRDLNLLIKRTDGKVENRIEQVSDLQRRISRTFSDVPVIFRYSPEYWDVARASNSLQFTGVNFSGVDGAEVEFTLGKERVPLDIQSDEKAVAEIPDSLLGHEDGKLSVVRGELVLPTKRGFWGWVTNDRKHTKYNVVIFLLPKTIAAVETVTTSVVVSDIEAVRKSKSLCHRNRGRSVHHSTKTMAVTATSGWKIVPASVVSEVTKHSATGGKPFGRCWISLAAGEAPNKNRFVMACHPTPENRHHAATICAHANYIEVKSVSTKSTVVAEQNIGSSKKSWGQKIPTGKSDVVVRIKEFYSDSWSEYRESNQTEWVDVKIRKDFVEVGVL